VSLLLDALKKAAEEKQKQSLLSQTEKENMVQVSPSVAKDTEEQDKFELPETLDELAPLATPIEAEEISEVDAEEDFFPELKELDEPLVFVEQESEKQEPEHKANGSFDFDALNTDLSSLEVEEKQEETSVEGVVTTAEKIEYEDSDEIKAEQAKNIFRSKDHLQQQESKKRIKIILLSATIVGIIIAGYVYLAMVKNITVNDILINAENTTSGEKPLARQVEPIPVVISSTDKAIEKITPTLLSPTSVITQKAIAEATPKSKVMPATVTKTVKKADLKSKVKAVSIKKKLLPIKKLSFIKTSDEGNIHKQLLRAYEFYQQALYPQALKEYKTVFNKDSNNKDALLGIAAISLKQGDRKNALKIYHKLNDLFPNDVAIKSALNGVSSQSDEIKTGYYGETKRLLEQNPSSPELQFNMGNILSAEKRWSEAQVYYFNAYKLKPNNADYLYNLAISLDYLSQYKVAVKFYQLALTAAEDKDASFNEKGVINRMAVLSELLASVKVEQP
jgi:Flp pilus assembly protein TadD